MSAPETPAVDRVTKAEIEAVWDEYGIDRPRGRDMSGECRLAAAIVRARRAVPALKPDDKSLNSEIGCLSVAIFLLGLSTILSVVLR